MSRAYRVVVNEQLRRHVQAEDGVRAKLEVLPILPTERMGELLGAELGARGFVREGDKAVRREKDGVTIAVDLRTGALDVTASASQDVNLTAERVAVVDEDRREREQAALRTAARDELERKAGSQQEALARRVAEQVEGRLADLRVELDEAVNRVTAAALKERAAQLGTIEEIHEDAATGALTIKVKV